MPAIPEEDDIAAREWVAQHGQMVDLVLNEYLKSGAWPQVRALQRSLDRAGSRVDVRDAVQSLPRLPGELRMVFPERLSIPLWVLRYVPAAADVLFASLAVIRRSVELYLSDEDQPRLRSDDPSVIAAAGSAETVELAGHLVNSSYPHPFAGGTGGDVGPWEFFINDDVVRQLQDVTSIDGYVVAQFEIARNAADRQAAFVGTALTGEEQEELTVTTDPNSRRVFVIHGRNELARRELFTFLRAIGLEPIEWSQARRLTGKATPYIGEILDAAFGSAQAVVVLQTPDDVAYLHPSLSSANDPECEPQMQPRANVLFETGIAMGRDPDRTVIVELGTVKVFSDIHGRHVVRLDNDLRHRQELASRLETAGCDVDLTGTDWHSAGDLTPPSPPGGGLPLGRRLPSVETRGVPRLEARYIDNGDRKLGEVQIINHGPGDVHDLNVAADNGLLRENDNLPLNRLPAGKSIRLLCYMSRSLGTKRASHFYVTITGKTVDGAPIEVEEFVGLGA